MVWKLKTPATTIPFPPEKIEFYRPRGTLTSLPHRTAKARGGVGRGSVVLPTELA